MDGLNKCCYRCKFNSKCKEESRKGNLFTYYCDKFEWHTIFKSFNYKKKK